MNDFDLIERARSYAHIRHMQIDESGLLGAGQDGTVWRTDAVRAVKVFRREEAHWCEKAAYRRLAELDLTIIETFVIPRLRDADDELQVIEMDIVSPPYLFDFGKSCLDRKPDFSPEVWQQWQEDHEEMWEGRWRSCGERCGNWRSTASITSTRGQGIFGLRTSDGLAWRQGGLTCPAGDRQGPSRPPGRLSSILPAYTPSRRARRGTR